MSFIPDRATLEHYVERARTRLQQLVPGRRMLTARPLRGLLLNTEQLEERVRALASEHTVVQSDGSMQLLQRAIDRNERLVNNAYRAFNGDARARQPITPAAEWLVDNIHVVTDQIREVRQDLPQGYYRKLPKLASGPYRGFPRIYGLALTIIEHTDGHLDQEQLVRCVIAYQAVAPLTMGEVWAVPIMLRLGLIDNIGRLANLTLDARELRVEANAWAERVLAERSTISGEGHPILREIEDKYPQLLLPFVVQLLRRLRGHEGEIDVAALIAWIERQPALPYNTAEELIHAENQRQAANQVSVANTITSMRMLNAIDWKTWFERVCLVEQVLRQDANGTYARGTFATRDRYRHELEQLARGSGISELDLARQVVDRAHVARREERDDAESHIGYYLVDEGRQALEREIGFRPKASLALQRALQERSTTVYFGAVAGTTAALVGAGLRFGFGSSRRKPVPATTMLATAALLVLPASAMAFELVNRGLTRILKPRVLPRLDLRSGVPGDLRTMVVVPTLLLTPDSVRHQLDSLEVLYLANEDPHLHFALLSDFADALEPHSSDDELLLEIAREKVRAMNERYGADRFFLLHRRRVWNEQQGRWMGWERKRGKLEEFNRLLAGAQDTTFEELIGDLQILPQIRYVITLDSDTQLPRDAAQALIGTIAHPLNRADVDDEQGVVTRGYGILQPRVGIDVASATASRFARVFAGNIGVDPYTMAVSDVYMDLFGEGIFAGKGIYDPQVLRKTLDRRFPENALLSHDLIEGNYARAGLLSDIELLDGYPTTYAAYAARQHRWVRGDWQIARWLLPRVPDGDGNLVPNVLSPLARYKIFDNLRRSLVPPAIVGLLGAGWLALPGRAAVWTVLALSPYVAPLTFSVIDTLLGVRNLRALRNLPEALHNLRLDALRTLLNMALLPDQAVLNVDAIARTLARVGFTRRNLLEWETAAQSGRRLTNSEGYLRRSSFPAIGLAALGGALRPEHARATWQAAAPVLTSWAAAPSLAGWLDQPYLAQRELEASAADRVLLRMVARATYTFFERFVTEEGHFLAPDNFQETPNPVVAFRTSPTNIGLQLLADLVAFDFGYLGLYDMLDRIGRVFATMEQLERHRGHLLNWYDTQSLRPLNPHYVSTVDSGNLAGSLLALRQGLLALRERPLAGEWIRHGMLDVVELIDARLGDDDQDSEAVAELRSLLAGQQSTLEDYRATLDDAIRIAATFSQGAAADLAAILVAQAESHLRDLENLAPHGMPARRPHTNGRHDGTPLAELTEGEVQHDIGLLGELERAWPALDARITALASACSDLVNAMDFRFLYEEQRKIFTIGYNVSDNRRDNSYYDLLASENRLASFVAIAKGDVPQEHWFHIGRTLTPVTPTPTLISWSGTMFEYLMPLLMMRNYPETLLDATYRGAVARQIGYAREQDVPWGISESGFNARDLSMNYQYRAFGVPGLGLQSGLGNDLVIAPYATMLALPVQFEAAMDNLQVLIERGMFGQCGLYEAIDFTPDRLPPGSKGAIVRAFMVHHQGMSLIAIDNVLHGLVMQQRFHAEPIVQATEMLLQEKIPHSPPLQLPEEARETPHAVASEAHVARQFTTPHTAVPYAHMLASGAMAALFTTGGGGFLRYRDLMVTRWRADTTCDNWGYWIYVRDARSGLVWSPSYQPVHEMGSGNRVTYALEKVEYQQRVAGIDTRMEITISPEDEVEVRRLTLTNLTSAPREIEVTSYAEVVLTQQGADTAHPAFANLFVETEYVEHQQALLASRRPRSATAERLWAGHVAAVRGFSVGDVEYETNRVAFLGRGGSTADPEALGKPLGSSTGAVLDPIFSLRRKVRIVPGGSAQIIFATAVGTSREQVLRAMERYRDPLAAARAYEMAWTQTRVELRHLGSSAEEVHRFQRLASLALYPDRVRRASPDILERNTRGQPALWAYGISGDYPIIVARVVGDDMTLMQELIQAHEYWRLKGMMIDLVLLNEDMGGYRQSRQDELLSLVRASRAGHWLNERGGIFVLRGDLMAEEDRVLIQTVARVVLSNRRGDLAQHLRRRTQDMAPVIAAPRGERTPARAPEQSADLPWIGRSAWNELGGFSEDGHEYVIDLHDGQPTPAPWSNVVANAHAGFIVSERGSSYTWAGNSRENRLTPWSNDPAGDPSGEALYLRDEASGMLWSPVPQPSGAGVYRVRHGFGYTSFEHHHGAVESLVTLTVAPDDPLKITLLELRNHGQESVRLSATLFVEWVLGVLREQMAPYVITELDDSGAVLARNPYNVEFGERVAFLAGSEPAHWVTGERGDFIGRNGVLSHPAALQHGHHPAGTTSLGAGFDPCAVWHSVIELAPGAGHTLVFVLGQGADRADAQRLVRDYTQVERARQALDATRTYWRNLVDAVQVRTPQPEIDVLLNGWLVYQTLACRVLGRSAFYQSGGAYGYRDQLQDVMALIYAAPDLARAQIVLHASRQFVQGDVQHWWHPPTGRGIRTSFSDDYLWLAFVTLYYVHATGDHGVLDEVVSFLEGRPLAPGEDEYYDLPTISEERAAVYEHCVRAIEYGLGRMGQHGLPLMGAGDWNDGMNMVGNEGRGESVWVAWFQLAILPAFAELADGRGDTRRAASYRAEAEHLRNALDAYAWDGEWYLRAFYDDGTPLGSSRSDECQIDSLSQSWSVISGGDRQRAQQAMQAVDTLLVDRDAGLIRLFTPAFDETDHNPGYIKGYVPGVRENGGQYTHAAIWVIWAFAQLGDGRRAQELFELINPVRHGTHDLERYQVEPYVVAADIYTAAGHLGRGGWTWYTGSAGWLYRLGIEMILGVRRLGDQLEIAPCISPDWPGYELTYRFGAARYHVIVERVAEGAPSGVTFDGQPIDGNRVPLRDDGASHEVRVVLAGDAATLAQDGVPADTTSQAVIDEGR